MAADDDIVLDEVKKAKGSPGLARVTPEQFRSETEELVNDIFKATRMRVSSDDPLVIAAFFQSKLLAGSIEEIARAQERLERFGSKFEEINQRSFSVMHQELSTAQENIKKALANQQALNERIERVGGGLQKIIKDMQVIERDRKTVNTKASMLKPWQIATLSAVIAAAIAVGASFLLAKRAQDKMQLAVSVERVWNDLPPQAQQIIANGMNAGK